jgi:hypothetical protein
VFYWEQRDYWHRIGDVYKKRNALIHQGQSDLITDKDLAFTDHLLVNVLANLVNLPILNSKNAVIAFSERIEAERILGVKPKVRPKDMRFFTSRVTFVFPDTDVRFSISTDDFSVIPSDT